MSETPDHPAPTPTPTTAGGDDRAEAATPATASADAAAEAPADLGETASADPAEAPADLGEVEDVRAVVDPASVRRAPRYRGFLVAGGVLGLLGGAALALFLLATYDPARDEPLTKPGVWFSVTVIATTTLGTLVAGMIATIADRRSLRRWRARQDADRGV